MSAASITIGLKCLLLFFLMIGLNYVNANDGNDAIHTTSDPIPSIVAPLEPTDDTTFSVADAASTVEETALPTLPPTNEATSTPTTNSPTTTPTTTPTTNKPTTSRPTTTPTTSNPTTSNPTTSNPTTSNPTTRSPTTNSPTTRPPTSPPSQTSEDNNTFPPETASPNNTAHRTASPAALPITPTEEETQPQSWLKDVRGIAVAWLILGALTGLYSGLDRILNPRSRRPSLSDRNTTNYGSI